MPFEPTSGQLNAINQLDAFFLHAKPRSAFLLKGYAGTGKTTLIAALVRSMEVTGFKVQLLAPTGRASKVMSQYSRRQAFTIHKRIFKPEVESESGMVVFKRVKNSFQHTLFIVDEASMVDNTAQFGKRGVLEELIRYVFEGENNLLMIIGDTAQLPPVGTLLSPALDKQVLETAFQLQVTDAELTEVVRQEADSGILDLATQVRENLRSKLHSTDYYGFEDVLLVSKQDVPELIESAYRKHGESETVVICRSNKTAVLYNQMIRHQIFWKENDLERGDLLMVVKNNYTALPENSDVGFIANGDIVEVLDISNREEKYGHQFADAEIQLVDYPDQTPFVTKILLDGLSSDTASLSQEQNRLLFHAVLADAQRYGQTKKAMAQVQKDPYLNALQVKFAYALTCHKSQGGQWKHVFVDQGFVRDPTDAEYLRWLYTAFTRATHRLYLVGF
jgi:exodeoxyribonuclease-5